MNNCMPLKKSLPSYRHVFCSTHDSNTLRFRLNIKLTSQSLYKSAIDKEIIMPYFINKKPAYAHISREILAWNKNNMILAEIMPTENKDFFILYINVFEKSKDIKITTSGYIILPLCHDAHMTVGNNKEIYDIKARLDLVDN